MKKIFVLASIFAVGLVLVNSPACQAAGTIACAIPASAAPDSSALSAPHSPLMSKVTDNKPAASPILLTTTCFCQVHCSNGGFGQGYTELVECAQIFATCCNNSGSWSCI